MSRSDDAAAQSAPPRPSTADRSRGTDGGAYTAEVAEQVGQAALQLGARLRDPGVPHSVAEIEQVTRGFATTVDGMAEGLAGVNDWLRAAGHAGALTGHAGAVGDRLAHVGRELARLAEAVAAAER